HPEEECLGELAVTVRHAPRDVEHEEDDRVYRRLSAPSKLPEAQVIVGEARQSGPTLLAASLDEFLERSSPIEPRSRATPVPPFADPVCVLRGADARLEVRQLHLLPQPVDDVVDLDLEQELDLTFVLTARALVVRATILARIGEHVARLGFALTHSLGLTRA